MSESLDESAAGPNAIIKRVAARVLLIDDDGRVLLFRGGDPARPEAGHWWFTPGGGVEDGETLTQAARREAREETGQILPDDLGPVIFTRTVQFSFEDAWYEQTDHFFRVRAAHSQIDYTGWTELELRSLDTHHWWTLSELQQTSETIHPRNLPDLLASSA
ncbi:MAG TPA: NUDIX domain-containing protein [Kineosporiaceae bacterium]|nr:NUDIX domain-containing protein [Kineosporiaceae bacterium]